jgi:mannosyltransferase OCH1-like enzyme
MSIPIPKRIILTAETAYTFSPVAAECVARIRALHPSWDVRLVIAAERREFIRTRAPGLLALYDFYPRPVQKADLFRVIAVKTIGGFYLDTDVYLRVPLDELRRSCLVLAEEWAMDAASFQQRHHSASTDIRDRLQIGNYGFGGSHGHWFFDEIISEMIRRAGAVNPSCTTDEDILFSTGPDVFSTVYARHRGELDAGFTLLRGAAVADPPESKFSVEPWWSQFGRFGTHIASGTWR